MKRLSADAVAQKNKRRCVAPESSASEAETGTSCKDADPVITLDVGGTPMQTRRSTLVWSSTYFKNILAGPFMQEHNTIFLDCDVDLFQHVLFYFRYRAVRPGAPLDELSYVADYYSVDPLLEEIERLLEVRRMVGTWNYRTRIEGRFEVWEYLIFEISGVLWFYEVNRREEHLKTPLTKNGDFYIGTFDGGSSIHLARRGSTMMSNFKPVGKDWAHDIHATAA